ncbi:TPA: hypothetical protein ACM6YW_005218 [Escherichia coli]|nr:hypothetical protein [Escherichia coli]EFG4448227.1 hypothetical protein [Escherichia coli]OWC18087.1 hypothetical protein A8G17_10515 [Escherichia coli]HAI0849376.1 hypothetical protein [Escherichia coli]HAI2224600.1 hypothetical protein [Escherichia coli]HCN0041344.1 hypothetical protein [Escherichia coli]
MDETKVSATLIDATLRWLIDGNLTMKKAFAACSFCCLWWLQLRPLLVVVSTTAILPLTAPAAVGALRIPAREVVAFVKNKIAKTACDMPH